MTDGTTTHEGKVWSDNPRAAFAVRAAVFLVPLAISFLAIWQMARAWAAPDSALMAIARFVVLAIVATIVAAATDRVARRMLPLAAILRLSLVFPDEAPSRFAIALRSNNTKKLEKRLAELESGGFSGTETDAAHVIVELAASLSKHDRLTRGHSERVRAFAALIGEEMALSPDDNNKLQWAALIHDVGKLKIPYEILSKPGTLTEREWATIKTHPAEGMRIAAPLADFLGPWMDAVGQHHERFDGGGYPQGLVGQQISLGGRIVAVADAYDVMTAARSYKPSHSAAWAREELARCAGTQFDPEVVRAFLNVGLGQVRRTMWPLSWALQLPFIGSAVTAPIAQTVAASVVTLATATGVAASGGGLAAVVDAPIAVAFVDTAPVDVKDASATSSTSAAPSTSTVTTSSTPLTTTSRANASTTTAPTTTTTELTTTTSTTVVATTLTTVTTVPIESTTTTSVVVTVTTVPLDTTTTTTEPLQPVDDCPRAQEGDLALAGAYLVGCQLPGMDLSGADLQGANLSDSDLTGAVLNNADLRGAQLSGADLTSVAAVGARFASANLEGTTIAFGDFADVDMSYAVLDDASISGTTFAEGDFSGATFYNAEIGASDFAGADLSDAVLKYASVSNTDFGGVVAPRMWGKGTSFYSVSFNGADLTQARFMDSIVEWSSFVDADLSFADFTNLIATEVNFDFATVDAAIFKNATIHHSSFNEATAEPDGVSFEGAELAHGSMNGARFPDAWFVNATFVEWNVAGGLFTSANFFGSEGVPLGHGDADFTFATCPDGQEATGNPPTCW